MIKEPLKYLAGLFFISVILFLIDETRFFSVSTAALKSTVLRPAIHTGGDAAETGADTVLSLFSFRNVINELASTEGERDFYRGEYFKLLSLADENNFLRQALQVDERRQELILANVVALNPLKPNQEITIDKGTRNGVHEGQAVIASGRILVGLIKTASDSESTVTLVTSEEARIPVLLHGTNTNAAITGSATGVLELDLIPREVPIAEGELVLTSGIAGDIPPNLPIGEIRSVIDDETASFKRATVKSFINIGALRQVFVVAGS